MKIVLLKSRLSFRGGLEKYTLQLAERFAAKGHEVIILTTGDDSEIKNIPIHSTIQKISLGKTAKLSIYHLLHFDILCKKWLKKNGADIVFGMERNSYQTHYRAGSGVHAAFLKRRFQTESFFKKLSFIFNPLHLYLLYLEKKAFEDDKLKKIFANSEMVKKEILTYFHTDPAKIEVVFNGVSWKEWGKEFLNFSQNRHQVEFLFVGNGYKRKGLNFLLPILSTLKIPFHLNIVGHEKRSAFFKKMTRKLGLDDRVSFWGPQSSLIPFYQKADVLLLPTLYDPCANVTLEALAMGLFVVTTNDNGASEVLREESGYILKDLNDFHNVKQALESAGKKIKTRDSAFTIRNTIKHLEFSHQLDKIVDKTFP